MTTSKYPLIVDLDGTLTPTDTLIESVIQLAKRSPLIFLRLAFWLPRGRAAFKGFVAANTSLRAGDLPYRQSLLEYLRKEKQQGRHLVLATASHEKVARAVSDFLGLFQEVIATGAVNLKGTKKLTAIRNAVGDDFVYAGDSSADLPIWNSARAAILVDVSASTRRAARKSTMIEAEFPRVRMPFRTWVAAIRVHQWLKNVLIFVPFMTAFSFVEPATIVVAMAAFFSFSLVASSSYLVNDILDIESDRVHARKRFRPIASGELQIVHALLLAAVCLFAGFVIAWLISVQFLLVLLMYLFVTSSYSVLLKRYVLIDVIVLSLLYTLRILAGSVAIGVVTSEWLLAFSVFLFLSLALLKRCSELVALERSAEESATGRDYRVGDLRVLWPLGIGLAISAVVVFGLFISSPETTARYASPTVLWLVALALVYWLSRLWIITARGFMHDDPVVFTMRDRVSRMVVVFIVATMTFANYVELGALL